MCWRPSCLLLLLSSLLIYLLMLEVFNWVFFLLRVFLIMYFSLYIPLLLTFRLPPLWWWILHSHPTIFHSCISFLLCWGIHISPTLVPAPPDFLGGLRWPQLAPCPIPSVTSLVNHCYSIVWYTLSNHSSTFLYLHLAHIETWVLLFVAAEWYVRSGAGCGGRACGNSKGLA